MPNPRCRNCLLEITQKAINLSTNDKNLRKEVYSNLEQYIDDNFETMKLPDISTTIFRKIAERTGTSDPFLSIKKQSNQAFIQAVPVIEKTIQDLGTKDALYNLFLFAIAANMVDFSTGGHSVDMSSVIAKLVDFPQEGLAIDDFEALFSLITKATSIVYLSDNCGEAVVDNLLVRYLVKNLGKKVFFGLKGGPVANDCMLDDFTRDNLPFYATETFQVSSSFGWNLHQVSDKFKQFLDQADLVIVKGQSNFETTLNNLVRYPTKDYPPIFCVLRTKCQVITDHLQVPLGSNVIKQMYPVKEEDKASLREIVD